MIIKLQSDIAHQIQLEEPKTPKRWWVSQVAEALRNIWTRKWLGIVGILFWIGAMFVAMFVAPVAAILMPFLMILLPLLLCEFDFILANSRRRFLPHGVRGFLVERRDGRMKIVRELTSEWTTISEDEKSMKTVYLWDGMDILIRLPWMGMYLLAIHRIYRVRFQKEPVTIQEAQDFLSRLDDLTQEANRIGHDTSVSYDEFRRRAEELIRAALPAEPNHYRGSTGIVMDVPTHLRINVEGVSADNEDATEADDLDALIKMGRGEV